MKIYIKLFLSLFFICNVLTAQSSGPVYITIEDIEFEKYLIDGEYDSGGLDGKILASDINYIKYFTLSRDRAALITSFKGIEGFTALEELEFEHSNITSLDLSQNKKLKQVTLQNNAKLRTINVTGCTNLTFLNVTESLLTAVNLTTNTKIATLNLSDNQLTQIDLSKNVNLKSLELNSNKLQTIDLSKNTKIERIHLNFNELTSFSLTNQPVWSIYLSHNKLTSLNASTTSHTSYLNCSHNNLKSLDLSNSKRLTELLTLGNPDLTCIKKSSKVLSGPASNYKIVMDTHTKLENNCPIQEPVPFSLPANNFTVTTKGENCQNAKNGSIEISALEQHTYAIKINNKDYTFTNKRILIPNLEPGTYNIRITVNNNYEQNFTAVIPAAKRLSGTTKMTPNTIITSIKQGTAPYTIFIDGQEKFTTLENDFEINSAGASLIEIFSSKPCEGSYVEKLAPYHQKVSAYPNPVHNLVELSLGNTQLKETIIGIYAVDGQLISRKTYPIINQTVTLNIGDQANGVYFLEHNLYTNQKIKILKK